MTRLAALLFACALIASPQSKAPEPSPFPIAPKLKAIAQKYAAARRYEFTGDISVDAIVGNAQVATLAKKAKIEAAFGEDGRYFFKVHPEGAPEYQIVSNGQKTWTCLPSKKQYTAEESAATSGDDSAGDDAAAGADASGDDVIEDSARAIVATLKNIDSTAAAASLHGYAAMKINGDKGKWPVLWIQTKKVAGEGDKAVELVFDPDSLLPARMLIATVHSSSGERVVVRSIVQFASFNLGSVSDARFDFDPPGNCKLVESLALPGRANVALVGHQAPDFELKTLDGEKVRLSDLRGKPVILSFWASWCGPCRHELPTVSKLYSEFNRQGLMIFGVNDEGKGDARRYAEKASLAFPTLDDGSHKAHQLYGVRAIPSVFMIDKDGKIAHYFRGARPEEDFRAALKDLGL